ncbi:hypothetical protein [Mesorhizobium sp.]|uniref:hypothetical protein n=1 Tax=Mesorhizobium sp. TaxID=1871066 RepID=UPI000FE8CBF5|nr:hypothetical protein [Mesorhizobium sp.]RWO84332.1 MAG: hypothetical protein EOQ95_25235 [Mesorhizobium sp.]RWQ48899.1 MAG: hypothetical protein EOS84_25300 [Mesorhizobium sp.]TIM05704.1 MAG: hypothetical protein E5Y62_26795 [Mesorhizobium sp.]
MTIATRAFLVGLLAVAQPASAGQHVVRCESGSWSGHTIAQMNDGSFRSVDDKIGYKETIYIFSDEIGSQGVIVYGSEKIPATTVNRYRTYTILTYTFGGVSNMDTIFDTGLVFNQYGKASFGAVPTASTFFNKCHTGE